MRPKRKSTDEVINERRIRRKINNNSDSDSDYEEEIFTISESPSKSSLEESLSETDTLSSVERSSSDEKSDNESIIEREDISDSKSFFKFVKQLKKKDPVLHSNFEIVFEEVKRNEPDIIKIISTNLQLKDKVKLFHLFEIYKNSIPQTHD